MAAKGAGIEGRVECVVVGVIVSQWKGTSTISSTPRHPTAAEPEEAPHAAVGKLGRLRGQQRLDKRRAHHKAKDRSWSVCVERTQVWLILAGSSMMAVSSEFLCWRSRMV